MGSWAGSFNGSSSSIVRTWDVSPNTYSWALTISIWIYFWWWTNKTPIGFPPTWSWGAIYININSASVNYRFWSWSSTTNYDVTTAWIEIDKWTNLIITHDSSFNRLYKDWLQIHQASSLPLANNASELNIWRLASSGNYFSWRIDEVIIENKTRTEAEVSKYYTYTQGRFWIL